jgi:hypothetical protein
MADWDTSLPPLLSKLHNVEFEWYADIDFEPFSRFVSAKEISAWFQAWTGNDKVDGSEFRVFGQDGSGGYAAFWLVNPSRDVLDQPIVFLGSEGETGVVAANFQEYLWLLAGGIGPLEALDYPKLRGKPHSGFTAFAERHSSAGPLRPEEVVARARKAYPKFPKHIASLCK